MSPILLTLIPPLMVAPFVGSFLGVLVRRLPAGRPIGMARSACEACGHVLGPRELVPIASFLVQRGRCRACHAPIARAHLWIELAAILVPVSAALSEAEPAWFWADCTLGWALLALGWIDWEHLRLPDVLTLPLLLAGLGVTLWLDPAMVADNALASAIGYAALRLVATGYRLWRRQEGLGMGDAKLLAAGGAWVGTAGLGPVLLVGAVAGFVAAYLRGSGMRAKTVVPFGTCLAAGIWAVRLALA